MFFALLKPWVRSCRAHASLFCRSEVSGEPLFGLLGSFRVLNETLVAQTAGSVGGQRASISTLDCFLAFHSAGTIAARFAKAQVL